MKIRKFIKTMAQAVTTFILLCIAGFVMAAMLSCKRDQIMNTSTREIIRKDSLIFLPGATVEKAILIDSLGKLETGKIYEHFDSLNRVQLSYMRDKFNRLNLSAKCSPDTVYAPVTIIHEKSLETITKPPVVVEVTPKWVWITIGALGVCLLAVGVGKAMKALS